MAQYTYDETGKAKPQTRKLWNVFWILLGITALEFAIAFLVDVDQYKWTKIGLFILLTLVKAYYIVGIFMHLKDEVKSLIWTVILPTLFVVWLLVALLVEGNYVGLERLR